MTQDSECREKADWYKEHCKKSDDTQRRKGKAHELDKKYPQICGSSTDAVLEFGKTPKEDREELAKKIEKLDHKAIAKEVIALRDEIVGAKSKEEPVRTELQGGVIIPEEQREEFEMGVLAAKIKGVEMDKRAHDNLAGEFRELIQLAHVHNQTYEYIRKQFNKAMKAAKSLDKTGEV